LRFPILCLCFVLAACSTDVENLAATNTAPPDPVKAAATLKSVAAQAKLQEPVEVSDPIKAPAISLMPWIICLRSGATEASRRITYSVFYRNDDMQSFRLSAIVERCETQPFSPLR
jgi:hypothetical protein